MIMDQSSPHNGLETEEEDSKATDSGNKDFEDLERRRVESIGEEDEEAQISYMSERSSYLHIPYGFQSRGSYKHASKNCEIVGVTHNPRFRQFVFLDSRGITSWSYESIYSTVTRHFNYPSYQFNVLRLIIFSRKFNVYFALSKEYVLKVFNLNFHEVFSVSAEMHSVLCMVFNHVKDELITGGTGGMKFWTFGEIEHDRQKAWERDSRPMANYGLVLRASYPDMGGSWVKQVELDEPMQRLYCLSERNVVAYDMEGNLLFQIMDAHRGPVTGCVFSKACNFLVTVGTDCDVNVWSRPKSGGRVHTFAGHSKAITKVMLHPENSALVLTAAMDGIIKVNSLDFMEEIYSLPVFSEGIYWMNVVSPKLIYCCSNRVIEVFSLNHLYDFWAVSRCSVTSLSLVTCRGKSTRVMAVGNDSSVRLISRKRQNLSTVLPPPPISPLNMVKDAAYNREFNMMYLLIDEQEIWVYYTRTNPATRVESWKLDFIEDIHNRHPQEVLQKSRTSSPWQSEGKRSPNTVTGDSSSLGPSSCPPWEASGRELSLLARKEKVKITCLGILYSPIIMKTVEGEACPDATQFLMAGTQDGRVLFLHMFWQGLKYYQLQANKDAVLELYHDQDTNTLITKCRHPGIVILIWSLPFLQLLKRVDCDADMTCFTRMNNILLCGHRTGYLHIHSLSLDNCELCEEKEEKAAGSKRSRVKDHQKCVNSVDSNSNLGIFCSASEDGVIKIWDRDKTLLREITMNETLTVASFLNTRGDILIGFKQHIFIIPSEKVYPVKDVLSTDVRSESFDDEAFETESDIYEDPSVRFESKKILQPDPTNLENYLVPFPNLQLKTSWFMEGRPPPDLEPQNQQEEEESLSFMSDSLSLAPTEVYCSPSSTPRRLSLVSSVAMSEGRTSMELWELPEFGDSPVSSPPRTPPPEPTPPSSPPPGEESEDDLDEGEEKTEEEQKQIVDPSCDQCNETTKETKKKISFVPSFRREKGRIGNITIDSRSLRSAYGGPRYAAPVARRTVVEKPEPKTFKPRRIPRPAVIKKTKKPKEKGEEEAMKEGEENETKKADNETEAMNEEKQNKVTTQENEEDDSSYETPNVVNMPSGEQKLLVRQDTATARRISRTSAVPQELDSLRSTKNEEKTSEKEKAKDTLGQRDTTSSPSLQKTADGNAAKAHASGRNPSAETEDGNAAEAQDKQRGGQQEENEEAEEKPEKRQLPETNGVPLVTYIDPDTGEVLQKPADEVPDAAEILEDFEDDDELEEPEEFTSAAAEDSTSSLRKKRSHRGQKSVSFTPDNLRPARANRQQLPSLYTSGRDSPTSRSHNTGLVFKEAVVPVYNSNRPDDLFSQVSKNTTGISPLTIFALARSRRENAERLEKYRSRSAEGRSEYKHGPTENSGSRTDQPNHDGFEHNDDDVARLIDKMDLQASVEGRETPDSLRPPSVRKTESTLMRWCIRALQKTDQNVLFPAKPTRPSSSPTTATSKAARKETARIKGHTMYLNNEESLKRPQTADTIRSNAKSLEEYSMFPYENKTLSNKTPRRRQRRDHKSAPPTRENTWKHVSSDEDEDFIDAYQVIRSSLDVHESDEDYMKHVVSSASFGSERLTDSRDIPVLDTRDYSGNWQNKVLERAHRLKQQRLERQKTATERRKALDSKQKERWKNSSHFECAQEPPCKSENSFEFITPPPVTELRNATPLLSHDQTHNRNIKEQELSNERPYRLKLNPQSGGLVRTPVAKSLMSLKASDHHVSDVANALPKPPPSASIPSKCSRYVLVAQPEVREPHAQATAMEETLLLLRFPNSRVQRSHTRAPISSHRSNRNLGVRTGYGM